MEKYKVVYEHPVFGVCAFEIKAEGLYLDSIREAVAKAVERDGGHLIKVCQVIW